MKSIDCVKIKLFLLHPKWIGNETVYENKFNLLQVNESFCFEYNLFYGNAKIIMSRIIYLSPTVGLFSHCVPQLLTDFYITINSAYCLLDYLRD